MPTVAQSSCPPSDDFLTDRLTSLPFDRFEFSPGTEESAAGILAGDPGELFRHLLRDQESETSVLVALRVVQAFLRSVPEPADGAVPMTVEDVAGAIVEGTGAARADLVAAVARTGGGDTGVRAAVLRHRAPVAMLAGCWLDVVSQPLTQPSVVVNQLFRHHFRYKGEGNEQHAVEHLRRRALADEGVQLPGILAEDFNARAVVHPLTALHGAFFVALSRLPGRFLPETVGVHYAFHALGLDDLLFATEPVLDEAAVRAPLDAYLALTEQSPDGAAERRRLLGAVRLVVALERDHSALLTEVAAEESTLSLEAKAARILRRHAPFAGRQHRGVKLGDRLLADVLGDPGLDFDAFMAEFRSSYHLRKLRSGGSRFMRALKFGGPMFGIFDAEESAVLDAWVREVQEGVPAPVPVPGTPGADARAAARRADLTGADAGDGVVLAEPQKTYDDRTFFHRLVHAESFPSIRRAAAARAEQGLLDGELLLEHGAAGQYTDASYFTYTPQALLDRVDRIYWEKLVEPYRPLTEIPGRDEVIFHQMTFALANLIDGTWACRIGNLGRFDRRSDAMLFGIYADEMGRGELAKNHVVLFKKVLDSMELRLPHIRDEAFLDQGEIPDSLYGFSIHQICLSLFPDSYYDELLGYNLAIEMFGLGEVRMHETEKLRRHGFDTAYEKTHLSIDNFSAGHARESAEIIISYLDDVRRTVGEEAVQTEWRRIWRGYASFAYFVEHHLVKEIQASPAPGRDASADADLMI